ncbi:uncharacterized protein LOC104900368 [Beta vulgaris subsp. vulgaris]|uniref:uncharacterized protein LOC104900368 n=1 Tax=Beta vulgaris subsp. vulgaris TaxID=3555 RepID=UPI002036B10C|nr:uncharacterized protein LOC104900368 [Beta vulgaris subsp. vulgaris]
MYCQPSGLRVLWDEFFPHLVEDYPSISTISNNEILTYKLLKDLHHLLRPLRKTISDYNELPNLLESVENIDELSEIMEEYFAVPVPTEDTDSIGKLNVNQRRTYDTVMNAITLKNGGAFFVDGPGGIGKSYLYRAILATVKRRDEIVIPTSTFGIAATLLHQGRTSHSTFQLPIKLDSSSSCTFTKS